MPFDPDAYLAKKKQGSFDPDAYLASKASTAVAEPEIDWTKEPTIQPEPVRQFVPPALAGADPTSVGPTPGAEVQVPFGLVGRGAKQYVNKSILDIAEKSRPSSGIVESVGLMTQVAKDLESLPEDPTFWQGVQSIPKIWWSLVSNYYAPKSKAEREFAVKELDKLRPAITLDVPPAEGAAEKVVDITAGIGAFVTQLLIAKKLIPTGTVLSDAVAWEILNQAEGGIPGQGAVIRGSLGALGKIPTVTAGGKAAKIAAGGGLFGGLTAVQGGSLEDIAVSTAIGAGFQAWGIRKQTQWLKGFKQELLKAEKIKVQGKKDTGLRANAERYERDLTAAKTPEQQAKASADLQKRNLAITRNANTEIERASGRIDKAMDIIGRKLHHGKLKGKEPELAKEIVEKGLTPEAVSEVGKVKLPPEKGEQKFAKARAKAFKDLQSSDPRRRAAGQRILDFLEKRAAGAGKETLEGIPEPTVAEKVAKAVKKPAEVVKRAAKQAEMERQKGPPTAKALPVKAPPVAKPPTAPVRTAPPKVTKAQEGVQEVAAGKVKGEKVVAAVVKIGGQEFEGTTHADAVKKAIEQGVAQWTDKGLLKKVGDPDAEIKSDLFKTSTGQIVDRIGASKISGGKMFAEAIKTIKPAPTEAAKVSKKVEQYWGKGHMITASGQLGPKIATRAIKGVPAVKGKELISKLFAAVQKEQISKEEFNSLQDRIADVISAERLQTRAGKLTKSQENQLSLQSAPTFEEVEAEIDKAIAAPKPTAAKAGKGTGAIGTISKGRIQVSMEPAGKVQTAAQIVHYVERAFNIPLRGKATHRKHALGWFDPKAVGIRLKDVRSLTTAMHEIGHHIDWTLNKRMSLNPPKGTKDELMAMGKALYGSRKPPGGYKSEGWAEFIRMDLTGEDTKAAAPNLHEWFHKTYLPHHQDIRKKLDKTRDMITQWRMQGAEARIESQVNRRTIKGTIAERLERGILWFETKWIDKFAPIRKAVQATGEELRWDLDPFQIATARASKAGAIARQMVLEYTTDAAGNYTGPGLREVIKPVRKDIRAFTWYMMAARGRNLWKRGINPGFSQADANFVFEKYDSPQWQVVAQAVTDWNHRILDYLVEAGGLEAAVAKHMKELNPVYIPFLRAFKVGEINKPSGAGKGFTTTGKSVKAIKGSGRQTIEMLEGMIQQTAKLLGVAHKTEVAKALAGLAKKKGMAAWIWKVPAPKQATQFEAEQLKKQITQIAVERLGLDPANIPFDTETWDDVLTVFTNAGQFFGKENIVAIVIDGEKQFFEVHPQLYRAIAGLDKYNLPPIMDMLFGKTTRMLRLGATGLNAAFGLIRNPIRDALTFTVLSKHAKLGPVSAAAGIVEDVINTKAARRFKALGGKMSGQILFDRTATQHLRGELLATTIAEKTVYHATHPINALRELFGITEAGTRIGEFGPALAAAEKKYGKGSKAAAIAALNAAQDVTTNFTRNGEYARVLNQIIPFFNAGIQGPSKILRTFRARPVETMIKALIALTLPALWLWWKNRDKDWYKNLPLYEKTSYLHVEVPGEDKIIRLPVPFELGHVFQSIPVAILDAQYQDDPDSMKGTMVEVMENANPFDWPALIGPIIDVISNENFAGIPIVSRSMEGKLPEDRVKSHTTALMRELGKLLNVSPAQLEHLVNSYSGGIYKRTARITEKRGDSPSDIPVIGTLFLRDPFAPKAQVERFYERADLLDQKNQSDQMTPAENRERLRLGRIRRKLSPLWKNLRTAKTVGARKQIWAKIEAVLKKVK